MRARLLEAAAACLLEQGHAATSIADVQARAGVARGTLLHHFGTKAELMVGAMEVVVAERVERFRTAAAAIPHDADRWGAVVDLAWRDLGSEDFFTALELWVAARTDDDLRRALVPVQTELFRSMHEGLSEVLGPELADDPRTAELVELTIDVLTGLSMSGMLTRPDSAHRERVVATWKRALAALAP